jgi:NitT/TauT family transport system ATP-binding protein
VCADGQESARADERDRLTTRSSPRFADLRARVHEQIHRAKTPAVEPVTS